MGDFFYLRPGGVLMQVTNDLLRWMSLPNVSRSFSYRSRLPLNSSSIIFSFDSISCRSQLRSPSCGSGRAVDGSRRSRRSRYSSRSGLIFFTTREVFFFFFKDALTFNLLICTLKDKLCAGHGLIERDFTSLDDEISLKKQNPISTTMRGIAKKDPIGRARHKFVKVALLQNETLATENSKMADFWSPAHHKLIRSLFQESSQEDSICNVASRVHSFGPIAPRSPMLIKHRPGHLNKGPILSLNNSVLRGNIRRGVLVFKT